MKMIAAVFALAATVSTAHAESAGHNADRLKCSAAMQELEQFKQLTKLAQKAYYMHPTEQNRGFRVAIGERVKVEMTKVNEVCFTNLKPSEGEADFR